MYAERSWRRSRGRSKIGIIGGLGRGSGEALNGVLGLNRPDHV